MRARHNLWVMTKALNFISQALRWSPEYGDVKGEGLHV